MPDRIVIQGVTGDGRRFRPSDWAERLCGRVASFGPSRRLRRSPYVQVEIRGARKCLVLDPQLRQVDRASFDFILDFARDNDLLVREEETGVTGEAGRA